MEKILGAKKIFWSKKYFGPQKFLAEKRFGHKYPVGPKMIFGSEKVKSTPRPAVLTIESILDGDKCCVHRCFCDTCPKTLFL